MVVFSRVTSPFSLPLNLARGINLQSIVMGDMLCLSSSTGLDRPILLVLSKAVLCLHYPATVVSVGFTQ